jgi:hypothetical protein
MKTLFALACSLSFSWIAPVQATVYITDYPHLSELKSRAEALFPPSFTIEIYGCGYENEPVCLIDSFELPLDHIYAICDGNFGYGYLRAVYKGDYNYYTRQSNTGTGASFDRVYSLAYSRETDEFINTSSFLDNYEYPATISPLPDEFYLNSLTRTWSVRYSGGENCFGFNLIVDYFDQSSFENRPRFLPILPLSRPKSGCYALAVPPAGTASDSGVTGLKEEVFNFSSSFVSGKEFLIPDNSEVKSELVHETENGYDKAYFAAQWVNPQCKWVPSHFRHKASFWGDISNFFSSLFF